MPEVYREPEAEDFNLDVRTAIDAVLTAATSDTEIADRVRLLAYLNKSSLAPRNLRDLGGQLGCSHVAAHGRLNKFKSHFKGFLRNLTRTP